MSIKSKLSGVGAMLALSGSLVFMGAAAAQAAPAVQVATNQGSASLCMNRFQGGTGIGTSVIGYNCGVPQDDAEYYFYTQYCGDGHVHASTNCPFTNHTFDAYYDGAAIVGVEFYDGVNLCLGSFNSGTSQGQLQPCGTANGGGGWSTIDVAQNVGGTGGLINVHWTNVDNLSNQVAGVCANNYRGNVTLNNVGTNGNFSPACQWREVFS